MWTSPTNGVPPGSIGVYIFWSEYKFLVLPCGFIIFWMYVNRQRPFCAAVAWGLLQPSTSSWYHVDERYFVIMSLSPHFMYRLQPLLGERVTGSLKFFFTDKNGISYWTVECRLARWCLYFLVWVQIPRLTLRFYHFLNVSKSTEVLLCCCCLRPTAAKHEILISCWRKLILL
jgi:hypothetical protein